MGGTGRQQGRIGHDRGVPRRPATRRAAAALALALLPLLAAPAGCVGTGEPLPTGEAPTVTVEGAAPAEAGGGAPADQGDIIIVEGAPPDAGAGGGLRIPADVTTSRGGSADLATETLGERAGQITRFYRLRHLTGAQIIPILNLWKSAQGRIQDFPTLNMIIITDTPEYMTQLDQILARLDMSLPQVEIEARVIEVLHTTDFEYGWELGIDREPITGGGVRRIDGTFHSQSFLESLVTGAPFQGASMEFVTVGHLFEELGDMDLIIRALERQGYADILSNPRILVQSGTQATIKATTREPVQEAVLVNNVLQLTVRYEEVGVTLEVTPQVIGSEGIRMSIHPRVSAVQGTRAAGAQSTPVPIIAVREVSTLVDVDDGETIVIGGLYERRLVQNDTYVPILGQIPLIGDLFRSQNERQSLTEIVFILKVDILSQETERQGRLLDPRNRPGVGGGGAGDGG